MITSNFYLGARRHAGLKSIIITSGDYSSPRFWRSEYLILTNFPPNADIVRPLFTRESHDRALSADLAQAFHESLFAKAQAHLQEETFKYDQRLHSAIYEAGNGYEFQAVKPDDPRLAANLLQLSKVQFDHFNDFVSISSENLEALLSIARGARYLVTKERD